MLPIVRQIAVEFKAELQKLYGDNLAELILFGSHARGDYHEESDIDFAVVLKDDKTTGYSELSKLSPVSSELMLKHSQFVSFLTVSQRKLSESRLSIYQNRRYSNMKNHLLYEAQVMLITDSN